MSLPQPKTALNNACSVIFNNTLYTYSAEAFQSLPLEPGAEWEELPQGERVTGGVCVGSTTGNPATSAFFVVGGKGGSAGYQGLQKYTYATRQWESIKLSIAVTHERVGHSAVYLNSTDSILMYAGNQDGSENPSSHTFTIGASAPHEIRSWDSYAPPSIKPILLPWSTSEAVMVGGSTWNTQVMLFSVERKWVDSGASLSAPLPKDTSAIQGVLMTGADGSKNLITFDATVSPNEVKRTILYSGPGVPVLNAVPVRRRTARKERRNIEPLTLNNWPAYNSTLAPQITRATNYALAQGPDGMVVIAGGNDEDVLSMFNVRQNSWEDTESLLGQARILSTESSSTVSTSTATSTSSLRSTTSSVLASTSAGLVAATETPTSTAAPAVPGDSGPDLNTILGAVLGGFFGLTILLAIIYICIKRQRNRRAHMEAGHVRRASGASSTEKDGIGFAKDIGQSPPGVFRGHQHHGSQNSFSSMAILMGRTGQHKSTPSGFSRKSSNESRRDSYDSTFKAFKSTISKPIPQAAQLTTVQASQSQQTRDEKGVAFATSTAEPKPRNLTTGADGQGNARRSSGWNRYWSGGSALNILGFGSGNGNSNGAANNSRRTTVHSDRSSNYSEPHRMTQDSATVPPLQTFEPRLSFSRVNSHSPTIAVHNEKIREGMRGQIETQRPISAVTDGSASAYSSGIPESVHEAWDPTAASKPWGSDRSLNASYTGIYSTPLAPASQGSKTSTQPPPRPARPSQATVRDDMSWLNLGS
ncbi:Pre-mRNA splicing factor CLF1 [Madurella fahalii]|uniref:Pre-mRNA splicing factor CLF1 n=1 Tax=Madurella fahalii TaxID=1157608 RepID=A0ABQ0G055_9PEZI